MGHMGKPIWVAQAIAGGEFCDYKHMELFPKTNLGRIVFYIVFVVLIFIFIVLGVWIFGSSQWIGIVLAIFIVNFIPKERKHWKKFKEVKNERKN